MAASGRNQRPLVINSAVDLVLCPKTLTSYETPFTFSSS
jgi:hypothetical protein